MRIVPLVLLLGALFFPPAMGMPADLETATAKAEQGDSASQWELGLRHLEGRGVTQDIEKAEQWLRKAAEQGDAKAQYQLGRLYDKGRGVTQDHPGAAAWYRKAAEQGIAAAQNNLGNLYRDGKGVDQDHAAAVSWYLKAANQGDAAAQTNLGILYEGGFGVAKDVNQAIVWLQKSARQGSPRAQAKLRALRAVGRSATGIGPATPKAGPRGVAARSLARRVPEIAPLRVRPFSRTAGKRKARVGKRWAARRIPPVVAAVRRAPGRVASPSLPDAAAITMAPLRTEPIVLSQGTPPETVGTGGERQPEASAPQNVPYPVAVPEPALAEPVAVPAVQQESVPERATEEEKESVTVHFQRLELGEEPGVVRGGALEQELVDPQYASRLPASSQQQRVWSRFVDNGNGTITDHQRKLVGLKNAHCFGRKKWPEAREAVQDLGSGQCQLTDESRSGDWRLPSMGEMHILLDWQESGLFDNVQTGYYWSGTLHDANPGHVWYLLPGRGMLYNGSQERKNAVWPVRAIRP